MKRPAPKLTNFGKLAIVAVIVAAAWAGLKYGNDAWSRVREGGVAALLPAEDSEELATPLTETPALPAPAAYLVKDSTIDLELSEYAGYAGLILSNQGLEPNDNSFFYRKHGFRVRIRFSEEECWPRLNSGQLAASATTVDVLPLYGRKLSTVVPAAIAYSRGADGIVVRNDIKRINDLRGKRVAVSQFNEADFFIRYLAQEASMKLNVLAGPDDAPDPQQINLLYCVDAFAAGDYFLRDISSGRNRIAGCVTWAPKTTEVVNASKGQARLLVTNKNLLIVADILVVNKGLAESHPRIVQGLVDGLLDGNHRVRADPSCCLELLRHAFGWTDSETAEELAKVHFLNLPENEAFFSGAMDAAGSFGSIYQSAVLAYGSDLARDPPDPARFVDGAHLQHLAKTGAYADQKIAISPIRGKTGGVIEGDPLLSKDIRFYFMPNSATLDLQMADNNTNLSSIKRLLQISPGSTILLRGHVDNALIEEFRRQGGDAFVRKMALTAMELSRNRAIEVKNHLVSRFSADSTRLETIGRGWEDPVSENSDLNRRVEVQWFTVE
jgi:NitT/TauT family transport system substrate-binding protein